MDVVEDRRWLASCNPRVVLMGTFNPAGAEALKFAMFGSFGSAGVVVGTPHLRSYSTSFHIRLH